MNLSKTRYCQGLQCLKILWLARHKPECFQAAGEALMETGHAVGALARGYFGAFAEVPYAEDKSLMANETKRLIAEGTAVIAEASFSHEGDFCAVDILLLRGNAVEIVEVKSSTTVKPVYLDDMAFQYYVLTGAGLTVQKISLMHINNEYERIGELDIQQFFTLVDCTGQVLTRQNTIRRNMERIKTIAEQNDEPDTAIGLHCGSPYHCGYHSYCWRHIPQNSVFAITGLREKKKFALYNKGILTFDDLRTSGVALTEKQQRQITHEITKNEPHIDTDTIRSFLKTITWPLYFLDFETFQSAIPPFDHTRPFMQIPFQYSLHIADAEGAPLEHREFLAREGTDPRRALAERLCADIPCGVCVLAYQMIFEKGVIKELAALYSDLAPHLLDITANIKDLMLPFQNHAYYRREFAGSYSIKAVLPALFPDDSELNYKNLALIHNGGEAMTIYPGLERKSPEEIAAIRAALLAYCRLDTLAMVKILEFLQKI